MRPRIELYQVDMGSIRASLEVTDGLVTAAVPVLTHSVGLSIRRVKEWVEKKGGRIVLVADKLRFPEAV